jgi:aryl-alcohol dehydrogenase-like predicted oxidoreductase
MQYRRFGRTNWKVSDIGYGMWGLAGWTGSDQKEIEESLDRSVELGCNFFDTAWAYGQARANKYWEILFGEIRKEIVLCDKDPCKKL